MPPRRKKTSVPEEFTYFDKFQGRKLEFSPKPSEIVVTFQPTDEAAGTPTPTAVSPQFNFNTEIDSSPFSEVQRVHPARGIAVFEVEPETDSLAVTKSAPMPDNIANTIPAFEDSEGLTRYFVPDEVTVQFKADISPEQAEAAIEDVGSEIIKTQRTPGYYTVTVPEGESLFNTIAKFSERDDVLFSEASEVGFDDDLNAPNDQWFHRLWGLENTGQSIDDATGTAGVDISVLDAWNVTTGAPRVVICVIDSGIDMDHPDLSPNLLDQGDEDWDFAADDDDPEDEHLRSHGTHVAGTCAAVANNEIGIAGVAPDCKLMPLRINLNQYMNQNRADALQYVARKSREANGAQRYVVNCSWRISGSSAAVDFAIQTVVRRGCVVLFAAGNDGSDLDDTPQHPAVNPNVIAVASIDFHNRRSVYTQDSGSNYGSQVDVSAPGSKIWSTVRHGTYGYMSGTSMACPHAAGVAALIWAANFDLSNQEVRNILETSCDNIDADNPDYVGKMGHGRINAGTSVNAAVATRDALDALT